MPFEKGKPNPGKGRQKGSKNKRTRELHEIAERLDVNPFEIMLLFAKGEHKTLGYSSPIPMDTRLNAAKEATQYLYSKKKAIEIKTDLVNMPHRSFPFPDPVLQDEEKERENE